MDPTSTYSFSAMSDGLPVLTSLALSGFRP